MIDDVRTTPYGGPASDALAAAVARAKGSSALAPVTVVVGSNFAGLAARRQLGSTVGVVNVAFLTPFRLAELLGADLLLDRRPLTNPVLGAAVRRVLATEPGPFRRVRDHVATESALAALYAELSNVSPDARARVAAGGVRGATSVRFHEHIAALLTDVHDEADLALAAAARPDLAAALRPFGHVVWHLPEPLTAPLTQFMRSVLREAPASVIVGLSGDVDADRGVLDLLGRAEVPSPVPSPEAVVGRAAGGGAVQPPTASRIVSVTDADEEVRAVLRRVVELAEQGVPLDRIGVFHPTPDPYIAILEQQFAAADLPANGPSRRRLDQTVAGRTLLAALQLPALRWRRDRVMALIADGPIRHAGELLGSVAMEDTSRAAGVIQDLSDWRRKIGARRGALQARAADPDGDGAWIEQRLSDLERLESFVETLAAAVGAVEQAPGWGERAAAARSLLHLLLGQGVHTSWPDVEQAAFERVEDALSRLAALAEIEPGADHRVFVRALEAELDVPVGRNGRFGEGVVYGPLSAAVGHDFDAVFVLGCTEGRCPAVRRDDAMLPDRVRRLAEGELELRADQQHHQHRHFLAALASAPPEGRTLLFPRGDLRSSKESIPSRWLLDTASALAGTTVHATSFGGAAVDGVVHVHSHVHGLRSAVASASLAERDQLAVLRVLDDGDDASASPVMADVGRGVQAQRARRSSRFTEWDGNLSGEPIPSTGERPLSPTRLEAWASCGFRYFLAYVLGLSDRDDPERVLDLSPLDRGSAVHEVLERFFLEVLRDGAPDPDQPWDAVRVEQLRTIADEVLDELERRGRTGRPVHWKLTRGDVTALLELFLDADARHRSATRTRPSQVELPFGLDGAEPVTLRLPDGRTLAFRGKADRVDVRDDGTMVVSDYKTGAGAKFQGLDDDPVQAGTTLQLGLYAEAAQQHLGATAVDTHYWMIDLGAGFKRLGYPWTSERRERFIDVVTAIADGIEGGVFPSVPGEWNNFRRTNEHCTYCEFDDLCPVDRGEQADAKAGAAELRVRDALALEEAP